MENLSLDVNLRRVNTHHNTVQGNISVLGKGYAARVLKRSWVVLVVVVR
jgi:hypothetical protein